MERRAALLLTPEESVLIVIDVQQKLVAAMPNDVNKQTIDHINILLTASSALSIPLIVTEQYPEGLGSTEAGLNISDKAVVVEKTSFSCIKSDAFCKQIDGLNRKQIVLTGMESHICILQTAFDLQTQGFQVYVVEDAVSSRSIDNKANALQRMRNSGVVIINVESVIFEWLGDAKHPEFKSLAKLIV